MKLYLFEGTSHSFRLLAAAALILYSLSIAAQVDPPQESEEEEDYSLYDNLDFADGAARRYCTSKVLDLSPQKLISLGYDFQGPYALTSDSVGGIAGGSTRVNASHGVRLGFNVPIYSSIFWRCLSRTLW
jgi:hypothetical protein